MSDSWASPDWILEMFHGWDDPCPLAEQVTENGLDREWGKYTYVNPPYSKPMPWILKSIEEAGKGKTVALLLRFDPTTRWYKELIAAGAHIMFFGERLNFADPCNEKLSIGGKFNCFLAILHDIEPQLYYPECCHDCSR